MIKAAIFDMDGTILDSMFVWIKPCEDYFHLIGKYPTEEMWNDMRIHSIEGGAEYMIETLNLNLTVPEMIDIWLEEIFKRYRTRAELKLFAKEYITKLYNEGVKICLATSSNKKIAEEMLEKFGLSHMFRFVITDDDVGISKTAPDIFLEAARRLDVKPCECAVIEDAYHAIKTAASAGFRVWGVKDAANEENYNEIEALCEKMIDFEEELMR